MNRSKTKLRGFTLLELVIVMSIIAILLAILVPNIIGLIRSNKITSANDQAQQVYKAAQDYLVDLQLSGMKPSDFRASGTSDDLKYIAFDIDIAESSQEYLFSSDINCDDATKQSRIKNNMVSGIRKRLEGSFEGSCWVAFYPDTFTVAFVCFNNHQPTRTERLVAVRAMGENYSTKLYTSSFGGGLTTRDQEYDAAQGSSTAYTGQCPIPANIL